MKITTNKYGDFKLEEVYTPVEFVSSDEEVLSVTMRDSGFEVWYKKEGDNLYQRFEFKNGEIKKMK